MVFQCLMTASITSNFTDIQSGGRKMEGTTAEEKREIRYTSPQAIPLQGINKKGILLML